MQLSSQFAERNLGIAYTMISSLLYATSCRDHSPRPCSRMSRFSSVPSSLGLYTNGTGIADDLGGVFVLGVVSDDSRRVISFSEAIVVVQKKVSEKERGFRSCPYMRTSAARKSPRTF